MTPEPLLIRHFEPADYPTVKAWWEGHGWTPVPETMLPRPGIVCHEGDRLLGAVWLYMSNSNGVAMMEWLVVDPALNPRRVMGVIKALIEGIEIECQVGDYRVIFTSCRQPALAKIIQRSGFVETDREMIHLLKILPSN